MISVVRYLKILPSWVMRSQRFNCTQLASVTPVFQSPESPETPAPMLFAEPLSKRSLIRVEGKEVVPFLQGLVTNDMRELSDNDQQSMFTMFLNNSGRVLYDSIIYKTSNPEIYLIECDQDVSAELRRHLRLYRVKKRINIDCINSEFTPWVVYNPKGEGEQPNPSTEDLDLKSDEVIHCTDPRLEELGVRVIQPSDCDVTDIAKLFPEQPVEGSGEYALHRCTQGVGEGVLDHPPGKCFPLEANCDLLHGISFHKGCYVGQELTARVHHTGVVRKRLMPLKLFTKPDGDVTEIRNQGGAVVGTIRSVSGGHALALLRVEKVLNAGKLLIDGELCKVVKPHWWPKNISD